MKKLLLLPLLLLTACPGFYEAPRPPTWDGDTCQPSEPYYLDLAKGTEYLARKGEIPDDPEMALELVKTAISEKGVEIVPKAEGLEAWEKFTTTFPDKIYVSKDFDSSGVPAQASILWHEMVHLREYEDLKPKKFFQHYLFAEGRWALEVQAYRETFRVKRLWGVDEDVIQAQMVRTAESLYEGYELGQVAENGTGMPHQCAVDVAVQIWMLDAA